jgi:hypothetical protein
MTMEERKREAGRRADLRFVRWYLARARQQGRSRHAMLYKGLAIQLGKELRA